jgi:hypothetical protein
MLSDERLRAMLDTLKSNIAATVENMPTHKDFLEQFCAAKDAST